MNSSDNLAELAKLCGKYLFACRMATTIAEVKGEVFVKRGQYTTLRNN